MAAGGGGVNCMVGDRTNVSSFLFSSCPTSEVNYSLCSLATSSTTVAWLGNMTKNLRGVHAAPCAPPPIAAIVFQFKHLSQTSFPSIWTRELLPKAIEIQGS